MMRRKAQARRSLPWVVGLAVVAGVGALLLRALTLDEDALVARADAVRNGDPERGVPRDPSTALEILEPLLVRNPEHFEGSLAAARAWADLRHYRRAIEYLERAEKSAVTDRDVVRAHRQIVAFLILGGQPEEAIERAQALVDLLPDNEALPLLHAATLYDASVAGQAEATSLLVRGTKDDADVLTEQRIETYVTDLWGDPDAEELVAELAPMENPSLRKEVEAHLLLARERLLAAADGMRRYRDYASFDSDLAETHVEILFRTGRVYEAHLESAIALRQPTLNAAQRSPFLEIQARCSQVIEEHGLAAERYQEIVDTFMRLQNGWCPPRYVDALLESRIHAEDWDWILAHEGAYRKLSGKDTLLVDWAHAAALRAKGDPAAALERIRPAFTIVHLGSLQPLSVRGFPGRRRAILALAYELFVDASNRGALSADPLTSARGALDGILAAAPDDLDARRLRVALNRQRGSLDSARADAFALLTRNRRNYDDFDLWLELSEELSLRRTGQTLDERAREIVEKDRSLAESTAAAAAMRRGYAEADATIVPVDPALAWAVVRERILGNDLERARVELRRLTDLYPAVQEFRFQLGRLRVREGELASAVEEFRKLLDDVPTDTEALDLTFRLQTLLLRHKEAAELVNAMILEDPLGVGAVRLCAKFLETGRPGVATELLRRLLRWKGFEPGLDVHLMAARAYLAQGEWAPVHELLAQLSEQHPDSPDVALLGLELGLAQADSSLYDSALARVQPMAPGLPPDQVDLVCRLLLDANLAAELLVLFPPEVRHLRALRGALRPLAEAAKTVGEFDVSADLLDRVGDPASLRDRFLLLALQGRADEASRQLRLKPVHPDLQDELRLCLLVGQALEGYPVLVDGTPTARLRDLGLAPELSPPVLELLDAALRLYPRVRRLDDVVPVGVVNAPEATYPQAGGDVARLVQVAREDPDRARAALKALILAFHAGGRTFWQREQQLLGQQALELVAGLRVPSLFLAERHLAAGRGEQALARLRPLLDRQEPGAEVVRVLLACCRQTGQDEWGYAVAASAEAHDVEVRRVLAEALLEGGMAAEARPRFESVLAARAGDLRALVGLLHSLASERRGPELYVLVRRVLSDTPDDVELVGECIEAVTTLRPADPDGRALLEELLALRPDAYPLYVLLAQAHSNDAEAVTRWLGELHRHLSDALGTLASTSARAQAALLRQSANLATRAGSSSLALQLNELALTFEPGVVVQFRELANLQLQAGHLDRARRYLEVLSIVNPQDKEAPLALAGLLFTQIGQPHRAAEVVRRAYGAGQVPPSAVEVLAAEAYLRGDVDRALETFMKMRFSPLVTADTMWTVARIAFASSRDDVAAYVFDRFLEMAPKEHPSRSRVKALRKQCQVQEQPAEPS